MKRLVLACLALLCISASVYGTEYTTRDLLRMTQESLYADWDEDVAHVRGVGRIVHDTPQGVLLARRGALVDAGRGLLFLRQELLKDPTHTSPEILQDMKLSGHVPPLKLLSESIRDGLYFVEVEANLSTLLSAQGRASLSGIQSLRIEEAQ